MADTAPIQDQAHGVTVIVDDDGADPAVRRDPVTGAVEIDQADGGVVIQFNPHGDDGPQGGFGPKVDGPEDFYRNLIEDPEIQNRIGIIIDDLIEAVSADDQSRQQALATRARGLDLLGIQLQPPRATVGDSASGQDGMASVTAPLLLENCLKGWATADAELLPAQGPAKVENVNTLPVVGEDNLGEAFERDLNWYLTIGAPEYVPDTSQMLLWGTYFGGSGFKKVYRCPIRRRPVSDTVDMKDLIVSDTTKDLGACERITHQMLMRPSVLKMMQMRGSYRDTPVLAPSSPTPNAVDEKIAAIQGTVAPANKQERPEDQPYTIWEIQCELNLPEFAPEGSEYGKRQVPLPFLITIDKDNREALALRRDWKPEDEDCKRKRMYVRYPYVPGPGFYGTGMLGILGNSSAAVTAAWREALDAGMFASFPGGLISKLGSRQDSSILRPAPGEFTQIDTNDLPIQDVVMGMPYKDVTAGLMAMIDKITVAAKGAGTAIEIPVGEGVQNMPVGTMLAIVEQATKIMSAAHKGMHTAQGEELRLIADLFREDPESFWRGNDKCPSKYWNEQVLFQALNTCTLVPRSDPNVPSHVHRFMTATAMVQILDHPKLGPLVDPSKVLDMVLAALRVPRAQIEMPPPPPNAPPPPPSPEMITAQAKADEVGVKKLKIAAEAQKEQVDSQQQQMALAGQTKLETIKLAKELLIHGDDQKNTDRQHVLDANKNALGVAQHVHQVSMDVHDRLNPEPDTKT